jgi:hydroxyacylglutathione hydrolase
VHVPLTRLVERIDTLPRDRPILIHCAGGYRSAIAASVLQRGGFTRVSELAGGFSAWERAALPVAHAPRDGDAPA